MSTSGPYPSAPRRRFPVPRLIAVAALVVTSMGWEGWRLGRTLVAIEQIDADPPAPGKP